MATTYKGAYLPSVGGDSGTWGTNLNTQTLVTLDSAIGGYAAISVTNAPVTLTTGVSGQDAMALLRITGTLGANVQITTAAQGFKVVENLTVPGVFALTMTNGVGNVQTLPVGRSLVIIDATNGVRTAGAELIGEVKSFAGASPPGGWLLCYGQAISRTTYAALYGVVGTTYGIGDGSTTFNVPDLRGRTIFGLDNMGGVAASRLTGSPSGSISSPTTLGASGGEEAHASTLAETANHAHNASVNDPGHLHSIPVYANAGGGVVHINGTTYATANGTINTNSNTTGITVTNDSQGGGSAHNNIPPAMVMNWIIKY